MIYKKLSNICIEDSIIYRGIINEPNERMRPVFDFWVHKIKLNDKEIELLFFRKILNSSVGNISDEIKNKLLEERYISSKDFFNKFNIVELGEDLKNKIECYISGNELPNKNYMKWEKLSEALPNFGEKVVLASEKSVEIISITEGYDLFYKIISKEVFHYEFYDGEFYFLRNYLKVNVHDSRWGDSVNIIRWDEMEYYRWCYFDVDFRNN